MTVDKIILGAGLYGLYAALQCGRFSCIRDLLTVRRHFPTR